MKGITPIVSIIILLLITIGLSAAAWTYINLYFSSLTTNILDITPMQGCIGNVDATFLVTNRGTQDISISGIKIIESGTITVPEHKWCELKNTNNCGIQTISPGDTVIVQIKCTVPGTPKTCVYEFMLGGRSYKTMAQCSG